ncbi:Inner membrane component of tripartite multidrug resistance system [Lactococcus lactis subsp. lactis]|nr:MFS transporter [Lactococcus lactis]KST91580.1 Inner membrane component of tripartite multidrug resistance system [Lactococcus lactis subsp. lactis]
MNNTNDFNLKKVLPAVLTIAIGMLLVMMDTTIMNVTLPHIQSAFHQNLSNSQWVITAYTLAMATVIPFAGFLGDRFSDKKVFALAIIFFTIASFLAANAHFTAKSYYLANCSRLNWWRCCSNRNWDVF